MSLRLNVDGIKADMISIISDMKDSGQEIQSMLTQFDESLCNIIVTDMNFDTRETTILDGIEQDSALHIFSTVSYKKDQDSKEAFRRPGIIQCKPTLKHILKPELQRYQSIKARAIATNKRLIDEIKGDKNIIKELWQESCSMLSLKQAFRQLHFVETNLSYAGLSIVKKPVVQSLTKPQAIALLYDKLDSVLGSEAEEKIKQQIAKFKGTSESRFRFRLARRGAPRPVLNIRSVEGVNKQLMASMPVFVFTDNFVKVGMPKIRNGVRKSRSDCKVVLNENKGTELILLPASSENRFHAANRQNKIKS